MPSDPALLAVVSQLKSANKRLEVLSEGLAAIEAQTAKLNDNLLLLVKATSQPKPQ